MASQCSNGEKGEWKMEDVCRLHRIEQSLPKRQLPIPMYRPPHQLGNWAPVIELYGCILRLQPDQVG